MVRWKQTNENLEAINLGLSPDTNDSILSVAGSFDVPFMFIEKGAFVTAVDCCQSQIDYGNRRIQALRNGVFANFICSTFNSSNYTNKKIRDDYFAQMKQYRLLKNLDQLDILRGDLINLEQELSFSSLNKVYLDFEINYSAFNKVYLSNIFDYYFDRSNHQSRSKNKFINYSSLSVAKIPEFEDFFDKFPEGTKFYMVGKYFLYDFDGSNSVVENKPLSKKLSALDFSWDVYLLTKY
ncbi:MAG: hypothetical protein ACQESC_03650 [Nanobdellota archaeon]